MRTIRVAVSGAAGKMGQEVVRAVAAQPDMELVGACDLRMSGKDAGTVAGIEPLGVEICDNLEEMLARVKPDVTVDFTSPSTVFTNATTILKYSHAVVGTTGLDEDQINQITSLSEQTGHDAIICPNFAIGAILMMEFAKIAVRFFPNVEIIELHHEKKPDAPSGTAMATARMLSEARPDIHTPATEVEKAACARGADVNGIRVHSVRLPGFVAQQQVIFGGEGQTLTITHDSTSRTSFMPGVLLAIRKAGSIKGTLVGLEKLLDIHI